MSTSLVTVLATVGWLASASSPAAIRQPGNWRTDRSDRLIVYYPPDLTSQAQRVRSIAEDAYERVRADTRRALLTRVTLVVYKTRIALTQQRRLAPGSPRQVMVAADEPLDQMMRTIRHEMVHAFESAIFTSTRLPEWIREGWAEYVVGYWSAAGLAQMRDVVRTDSIPQLSMLNTAGPRSGLANNVGHAAFEFIESSYTKDGLHRFLSALMDERSRANVPHTAFGVGVEQFQQDFERYLKKRFGL